MRHFQRDFIEIPDLSSTFEGTPTRYTPPRCYDQEPNQPRVSVPCSHDGHDAVIRTGRIPSHTPEAPDFNEVKRWLGLVDDRRGGRHLRHEAHPGRFSKMPSRTMENIAACAVLGLSYWCDSHEMAHLWAIDDERKVHHVFMHRTTRHSEHACRKADPYWDPETKTIKIREKKCPESGRNETWSTPAGLSELPIFEEVEERTVTEIMHGHIGPVKPTAPVEATVARKSRQANDRLKASHITAADRRAAKAAKEKRQAAWEAHLARVEQAAYDKRSAEIDAEEGPAVAAQPAKTGTAYDACVEPPMSRAVARSILVHDPAYLGDITNAALVDLLNDETIAEHHDAIRHELKVNRGLTERTT